MGVQSDIRERFVDFLSILACFGLTTNLIFMCLVKSRKNLRKPIIIIIAVLVVTDILWNLRFLTYVQWQSLWVTDQKSCKSLTFLLIVSGNFESRLLVTFLIVFAIRTEINKKISAIIILIILFGTIIEAIPKALEAEIKDVNGTIKCIKQDTFSKLIAFLTHLILPVVFLAGLFVIRMREQTLNREILKKSQDFKLLQMMMIFWVVLVGPTFIFIRYIDEIYIFFGIDFVIITDKVLATLSILNVVYKPFLIYFVNEDVKTEVDNLFRSSRGSRSVALEL